MQIEALPGLVHLDQGGSKSQPPNLDEGILHQSNTIFLNGRVC